MRRMVVALAAVLLLAACGGGGVESDQAGGDAGTAAPAPEDTASDTGEAAPEGEPIRIGMATTLSGSIALFGEANRNGAQLAIDELNAAGGVLGRPLELIVRDDQAQPEEGATIARDLIIEDEVAALLGPVSSGVALAITEIAEEREVPFITHTANTEALTTSSFHPYFASVVPSTGMEARAQGVDLADEGFTRWATIAPNYEFGQRQTATFVETIQAENPDVEIVEQQFPELGEADLQPFITSILSADPEAVYSPLFAGDLVTFTQQAANLGFFDQLYFTALYETDALQELGDQYDLEGVRGYSRCPFTVDTPQMADFVEVYTEEYGEVPSDWACLAYDAVRLWAGVAEEAGEVSGQAFADNVGGFAFQSLRGDTEIRDIDHQAAVASYIGTLSLDEELGFYTYADPTAVPAEETWLDEAAVEAARQGGR
jgi:branched-chain amino acid transport system substrate-binding protein